MYHLENILVPRIPTFSNSEMHEGYCQGHSPAMLKRQQLLSKPFPLVIFPLIFLWLFSYHLLFDLIWVISWQLQTLPFTVIYTKDLEAGDQETNIFGEAQEVEPNWQSQVFL